MKPHIKLADSITHSLIFLANTIWYSFYTKKLAILKIFIYLNLVSISDMKSILKSINKLIIHLILLLKLISNDLNTFNMNFNFFYQNLISLLIYNINRLKLSKNKFYTI